MTDDSADLARDSDSAAHRLAQEIRRLRIDANLSQARLAAMIGYSPQYVSLAERPGKGLPSTAVVQAIDNALGASGALIALWELARAAQEARRVPMRESNRVAGQVLGSGGGAVAAEEDEVRRLEFIAALVATGLAPVLVHSSQPSLRLGPDEVAQYRDVLTRLYELDHQHGGATVYELTLRTVRRLRDALATSRYDAATGRALQSIAGQATEHAGWLAFDAGRHAEARQCWLEAMHTARMIDDTQTDTVVLASMSLQAAITNRPRDAVGLAELAQQSARTRSTPRLRAALLAREACGHAGCGDPRRAWEALSRASDELNRGHHDDDPPWLDFFDEADLACHRMRAAIELADWDTAMLAARDAVANVDEKAHPRNHTLYLANLAHLLLTYGDRDEALAVTGEVVTRVPQFGPGRVAERLTGVLRRLDHHRDDPSVGNFLDWSATALPSHLLGYSS